jgi:hypothetical protein
LHVVVALHLLVAPHLLVAYPVVLIPVVDCSSVLD